MIEPHRSLSTLVSFLVVSGLALGVPVGCDRGGPEPPSESEVKQLELTEVQTQVYGTKLNTLPDQGLRRPGGESFSFDEQIGDPLLLSAVYTNCPMEKMCPLLTSKVAKVQSRVLEDSDVGTDDFRVVLFSFDPERDTPKKLEAYATERGVSADNAVFVSGEETAISEVMNALEIATKEDGDGTYTHNMRTYIADSDGRIYSGFRKAKWRVDDVADRLRQALDEK